VRGHRAAQGRREHSQPRLQHLEPRVAGQRHGLQHAFAQLVVRRVGVVIDEQLIDLARQSGVAAVADLDFDALDVERHHQAVFGHRADAPEPIAADATAGFAQPRFFRQRIEDHAHVDIGALVGEAFDRRAGNEGEQRRIVEAAVRIGHALRDRQTLPAGGIQVDCRGHGRDAARWRARFSIARAAGGRGSSHPAVFRRKQVTA
jgi:hypothetical protein